MGGAFYDPMIGYKDRTFCTAKECRKFKGCPRALTEEVRKAASKWWGSEDAPIDTYGEPKELSCYEKESNHGKE